MQNYYRKPKNFIFLLSLLFITANLKAQDINTFHYMRGVPQVYQMNPAIQPDCNFFFGIPGVSPIKLQVKNDFGLGDVIQYSPTLDSLVFFLHPDEGIGGEEFLNRLKETNSINTELSASLMSLGFRANKTFISLDIKERFSQDLRYSKDFFRFPMYGLANGEKYDLSLGLDMSLFNEMSLGVSQKIGDKLTIGVRGKVLFGQANINTEDMNLHLESSTEALSIQSDINISASLPYLPDIIALAANVTFDSIINDFDIGTPTMNEIKDMVLNMNNLGFGVDIGVDYRVFEWLQLNASVIDLGGINWKEGMMNLTSSSSYTFEGLHFDMDTEDSQFDQLADSLETSFNNISSSSTNYRTTLPTKVFAGVAFYPARFISFGALSRTDFYKGDIRQQFTFSTNIYPIRMISTSFSYSIIDGTYKNLGFGLALKLLPLNIYILTDTGPSIYFWPPEARMFNFKLGINFMLGHPDKKKKEKVYDMPLVD